MAGVSVLLLLCINDTPENGRWECTARCLTSLGITAQLEQHPLWIVDNGSTCPNTARFLQVFSGDLRRRGARLRVFRLPVNRHATYAFNRLLAQAPPEACVVRLENDMEFHTPGWPQRLAGFLERSGFGMASPRPADLPDLTPGLAVTEIAGVRLQDVDQLAGFCTAIAPELRSQLGALQSAGIYIEDAITSARVRSLGWRMARFAPDELLCYHVDREPGPAYRAWKEAAVAADLPGMRRALAELAGGTRPPYVPFAFEPDDGFVET